MTLSPARPGPGLKPSATLLAQMADALAWPLLLLRRNGALLHANLAARHVLRHGQPLVLTAQRRVQPAHTSGCEAFSAALQGAEAGPHLVRWPGPKGMVVASVSPLPPDETTQDHVLVALSTGGDGEPEVTRFAQAHGLSQAETRVLRRLARGDSVAQTARMLGVTPATVRSQTVTLRRKTGHASVAALLRSLAMLPPVVSLMAVEGN